MVRSGGASTFPIVNWLAMPCGRLGRWAFLTLLTLAVVVLLIHERFTLKNNREKKMTLFIPLLIKLRFGFMQQRLYNKRFNTSNRASG